MNKQIEFGELRITDEAKQHIQDCLDSNWVSIGKKTLEFEQEWQKLFRYNHTVMVNSGTSADMAACMVLYEYGAKPGDYVICPALSYIATANAIRAAGFEPLFVDVERETLNIDVDLLEEVSMSRAIAGIMGVSLMGRPCELDRIKEIADHHKVPFIVDNCEAYGSTFKGNFALHYADMETTSHYIAHIICCGEGGTVSTDNIEMANAVKSIRSHGRHPDCLYFDHVRYGLNLKPTDLCASIGLGELKDFWKIFISRKTTLYRFREAVKGFEDVAYFVEEDTDRINAPHGFSITLREQYATENNMRIITGHLQDKGIHWKRNFGSMPHHKAFKYLGYGPMTTPNAQYIGRYGIHVGCHFWLTEEDKNTMAQALHDCLELIK